MFREVGWGCCMVREGKGKIDDCEHADVDVCSATVVGSFCVLFGMFLGIFGGIIGLWPMSLSGLSLFFLVWMYSIEVGLVFFGET